MQISPFRKLFSFKKPEIDAAFRVARLRHQIYGLKLLYAPGGHEGLAAHGKLLIIIPRKAGKAHDRNRLRRQLKAIFYQEQGEKQPGTFILLVYKQAVGTSFEQLKAFLLKGFFPLSPSASKEP